MTTWGRLRGYLAETAGFHAAALFAAAALKWHYHAADSDGLAWLLSPTAALVDFLSGIHFEQEAHAGFISREHGIVLVPACAGVNFLIVIFSALCFSALHRLGKARLKILWLGISALTACLLTIVVNALRVIASVFLYRADIYDGWVTPERVHCIEGVFVYVFSLILICAAGVRIAERLNSGTAEDNRTPDMVNGRRFVTRGCVIGLFWYLLVTVGIPLANGAWLHNGLKFAEHCVLILSACSGVLFFFLLIVAGSRGAGQVMRKARGR